MRSCIIPLFASALLACDDSTSGGEEVLPVLSGGAGAAADVPAAIDPGGNGASGSAGSASGDGSGLECPNGQTPCVGSGFAGGSEAMTCVDTSLNGAHCGTCGNACAPGQVCFGSSCSAECGAGFAACGSSCTDTASDPDNCGGCGLRCGAGSCNAGSCPAGKACAVMTRVSTPNLADFETYVEGTPAENFGFAFNAAPGTPEAVYAGPYHYGDGTGAQVLSMVAGNGSGRAVSLSNPEARAWGGALGFWMGCIDAAPFDGISFSVRGQTPGGVATLQVPTEGSSAPDAMDPDAGGTCTADCAAASAEFRVSSEWQRVRLPWSAFAPGAAAGTPLPLSGERITGLVFSLALGWTEDPTSPGAYAPAPEGYELVIDDITFFRTAEECGADGQICESQCVDLASSAEHCGTCGATCSGGAVCGGSDGCVCPNGLDFCAGACADTQADTSHCGTCGNFCAIGQTCTGGACSGGSGGTSTRCGQEMRRLGNPLGCDFGWGNNPDGAIDGYVDFATRWVGYEPNIDTRCDGCGWLQTFANTPAVPVYIAYFIAYRANLEAGLGDCNLDFDGQNLCTGGAGWIRANRARILELYASYARRSYAAASDRPVIWILEPDFSQYAEGSQGQPLSYAELGALAADIMCAIKSNMPNAVIALNHSTWLAGAQLRDFWNAMPLDLIDLLHVTSSSNIPGGYFNATDANGREDGTFRFLSQLTGKPILADTSFGVTTMADSWSTASADTLNARIADGVIGALVYPTPGDYAQRIAGLAPALQPTCP